MAKSLLQYARKQRKGCKMKLSNLPGSFYERNGRWSWDVKLPGAHDRDTFALKPAPDRPATKSIKVAEEIARQMYEKALLKLEVSPDLQSLEGLCQAFLAERRKFCSKKEDSNYGGSVKYLLEFLPGTMDASEFNAKHLKDFMYFLADKKLGLRTINKHAFNVRRIIKWAVPEGLLPGSSYVALQAVQGLKRNQSKAKNPKIVDAVADIYIERTLPYLVEVVADMVRLHRITGMRSTEICIMRPCDIDTTGEIWLYKLDPDKHKSGYVTGKPKIIPLGKQAQDIVSKYLKRRLNDYLFKPAEADQQRREFRHQNRKVYLSSGNRPGTNRKGTQTFREHYTSDTYKKAIIYAIEMANKLNKNDKEAGEYVPYWTPHQLRHNAGYRICQEMGLEAASAFLGHSDMKITERYAHRHLDQAIKVAMRMG